MTARILTNAWFGDCPEDLAMPTDWRVSISAIGAFAALGSDEIGEAVRKPIGCQRLLTLAKGRGNAVVLIEDLTRPARLEAVLGVVLDELNGAGIADGKVTVIVANGTHRPMTRSELLLKIGPAACRRVNVLPHNCYDGLAGIGRTRAGTEVALNAVAAQADLLIGIGGVYPHGMAGFSGGAKIVLPGVAGIESIAQNHMIQGTGYGSVDGNPLRADMEEAARMARLRFIVNCVVNDRREICGVFAGDPVAAHRRACELARTVCRTEVPGSPDLLILNAYPMDTDLFQAAKALGPAERITCARRIVLIAGCPEGFGHHALCGPGGRFHQKEKQDVRRALDGKQLIICSRNIEVHDVTQKFPESTRLCRTWGETVETLREEGVSAGQEVVLLPTATIQIPTASNSGR